MGAVEMWREMARLLDTVASGDRAGFLAVCLDRLIEHFGAERAVILQSGQAVARVIAARGSGGDLTAAEREEISKTLIREVERTGECVVWTSDSDASSASREALAITAALCAPLRAFTATRGVLYLDFRDVRVTIDESAVEFFRAAAALVSTVLEQTRALDAAREDLRVAAAREQGRMPGLDELLWAPSMAGLRKELASALRGDSSILILGESGTGKTAIARAIADAIGAQPIVRAVLGASDDLNTITSELFGHERGAFSGAMNKRVGLVELADKGTLILDEILNLPKHAQQLLLDFSQFGTYRPLGHEAARPKQVKVRLIAATNGDLDAAVKENRFRLDLYYRLAGAVVRLPPLRERRDEIPLLAEATLARIDPDRDWTLAVPVRRMLLSSQLRWPGNIRQLEHVVMRARDRALADDPAADQIGAGHIEPSDLGLPSLPGVDAAVETKADAAPPTTGWKELEEERNRLDEKERAILSAALARHGGVVARVARDLGLPRSTLIGRLRILGLG